MSVLSAILYGILQGATEFLPVSSSGHLALAHYLFGIEDVEVNYLLFDILLHLGTLVAVFIAYFKDIQLLVVEFCKMVADMAKGKGANLQNPHRKMGIMLILSTLPLGLVLPIKGWIESFHAKPLVVGGALMVTGLMLWFIDSKKNAVKPYEIQNAPMRAGVTIGLFQAVATLPGISRSGATITGGILCGFSRELAVKYSFLMSIPAIVGANLLSIKDLQGVEPELIFPFVVGMIAAAITGFFAIRLITYLAMRKNFRFFSRYCLAVGFIAIIAALVLQ